LSFATRTTSNWSWSSIRPTRRRRDADDASNARRPPEATAETGDPNAGGYERALAQIRNRPSGDRRPGRRYCRR
jgi:hypothetical protein